MKILTAKKTAAAPSRKTDTAAGSLQNGEHPAADSTVKQLAGFFTRGAAAQSAVNETITALDQTMRAAFAAAGVKDEAAFRRLPASEQNDFIAQAGGQLRQPMRDGVRLYDPRTIRRSPFNRVVDESDPEFAKLCESIREKGVLQNGVIRPVRPPDGKVEWELIIGEHRWRAALRTGAEFPATVRECDDIEAMELQASENFQRKNLNPMEEARVFQQLRDAYVAAGEGKVAAITRIEERLKIKPAVIYERIALLELPEPARELVSAGRLPASHAALLTSKKLHDPQTIATLATTIANKPGAAPIPLRESERLVKDAEEREARLAEWQRLRDEYQTKGWKVLSDAENKRAFPYAGSSHLSDDAGFIHGEDSRRFHGGPNGYKPWLKAMGKHAPPPALGRSQSGQAFVLYERRAATAAVEANTPRTPRTQADGSTKAESAERAKQAQKRDHSKQRKATWVAILDALVAAVERGGDNPTLLRVIAAKLIHRIKSSSERARQVVDRRGLRVDNQERNEAILDRVIATSFDAKKLRGLIIESLAWDYVPYDFGSGAKWQPGLVELGKSFGVDVEKVTPDFSARGNPPARVKSPPAKRTKSRGLSPEARAKLVAGMKARWAAQKKRRAGK